MSRLKRIVIAAVGITLSALPAFAEAGGGVERLYVLDCGQGRAGDQSRW